MGINKWIAWQGPDFQFDVYLQEQRRNGTFAGDLMVHVLAHVLQTDIVILDPTSHNWSCVNGTFSDESLGKRPPFLMGLESQHYQSYEPIQHYIEQPKTFSFSNDTLDTEEVKGEQQTKETPEDEHKDDTAASEK